MKFLLDENMPPSLVDRLKKIGHEADHVNSIGLKSTADSEIFQFALQHDLIIITHDNDFGVIHAFSLSSKPSVILFRLKKLSTDILAEILEQELTRLEEDLNLGAFVSIDENSLRVRRLPITK